METHANVLTTLRSVSGPVRHRLNGGDGLHRAAISRDGDGRLGYHRLIHLIQTKHIQCTQVLNYVLADGKEVYGIIVCRGSSAGPPAGVSIYPVWVSAS